MEKNSNFDLQQRPDIRLFIQNDDSKKSKINAFTETHLQNVPGIKVPDYSIQYKEGVMFEKYKEGPISNAGIEMKMNNFKRKMSSENKIVVPKIKNFDELIEEKNQQMDYEIPPHVYNEAFIGEEYSSSRATSQMKTERITDQMKGSGNESRSSEIDILQANPVDGLRNIVKAMETSGKDGEVEIKVLKVTIRKLQYRDAVLRQKIAQITSTQGEKDETIKRLETENRELESQIKEMEEHLKEQIHGEELRQKIGDAEQNYGTVDNSKRSSNSAFVGSSSMEK